MQPLPNLKKIDLLHSKILKEIPNLLKATSLETLELMGCESLVEIPSSVSNLQKLKKLSMQGCVKLQVIPSNINLVLLEDLDMGYCSRLRTFPDISKNLVNTKIEDVPSVVGCWSRLERLDIGNRSLKRLTHVPLSVTSLDLSNSGIKRIPDCVIGLLHLEHLTVENCRKLVSIPGLPPSLKSLNASSCVSLERVRYHFHNLIRELMLYNCVNLNEEARRVIIQPRVDGYVLFPGVQGPAEYIHKATGNSITIPSAPDGKGTFSVFSRFKACLLLPPMKKRGDYQIKCRLRSKRGVVISQVYNFGMPSYVYARCLTKHLLILRGALFLEGICHDEVDLTTSEILFEFISWLDDQDDY